MDYEMFIDWFNRNINPFNYDFLARSNLKEDAPGVGDMLTDEQKNQWAYDASGFPIIGDYYRYNDNKQQMQDYMENTGVTWDQVQYPSLLPGAGTASRGISSMLGLYSVAPTVSKNLSRLYY